MKCIECPDYAKCVKESNLKIKRKSCKKAKTEYVMTNADRIRAMSNDEMAQEMIFFCPTDTVFKGTETYEKPHYTGLDGRYYSTSEELVSANLEWLQQPVK